MVDFSQGIQGAAGGAMGGSAFGPVGAIAGGALGALGGLFGGGGGQNAEAADKLNKYAAQTQNRQAPQTQFSDYRADQQGLIAQLRALASGQGPSAAQYQMQEAMDRAAAAQTSAAAGAGGRGVNQGAAYLNAANNTAALQAQGARDAATLRAQEQLNATGQLGQVIQGGRQSDEAANMANMQAKLQMYGLNDEVQLKSLLSQLGVQSPGLGTQLLAGGAQALPGILQMRGAGAQQPVAQAPGAQPMGEWGGNLLNGLVSGGTRGTDPNSPWNRLMNG